MSDTYIFSDDPRSGALTYDQLQARRKIALALASRSRGFPKNIGEGLTYLGESLGEMYADRRLASAETAQRDRDVAASRPPPGSSYVPGAPPAVAPGPVSEAPDIEPQKTAVTALAQPETGPIAEATATRQPLTTEQASQQPSMSIEEWKRRVARNESGGQRDPYSTVGERSRQGDYPYGKYQVMGTNVPKWTQAYLGRKMTPKEFLADPEAQEQVASARGGEYMTKYGPIGAAQAWFGGENWRKDPRATDTLGTHVAEYTRRFNIPLVERDQVVASAAGSPGGTQLASLGGGMPTPDTAQAPPQAREQIVNQLMAQQQPQMQPGIRPGAIGPAPAPPQQTIQPAPQAAPPLPPSREPIPPASLEEMRDPGEMPKRPDVLPPSQQQQYWAKQMDNPMLSDAARARAARMYTTEEGYRKEIQGRQAEEYKNEREKWEAARLAKDKHDREAPKRIQEEMVRRLTIEKEQALAANRPAEAAKIQTDLDIAIRNLNKPDTVSAAGTEFQRPYAPPGTPQQPYAVPPGLPRPKEDLTETQAKATTFIVRTKPDLDRVDAEMKGGQALTSFKDAAIDALGPMNTGNVVISDDYRRARDALGNWGAAFLTHVSGAAVSPSEALRNLPAFIPRPGDTPRDVAEKAERRRNMMDAIATGAGDVGMKKVHEMNDAYEYRENGKRPPVAVKTLEEAQGLPPGTRIIDPEGKPRRIPPKVR